MLVARFGKFLLSVFCLKNWIIELKKKSNWILLQKVKTANETILFDIQVLVVEKKRNRSSG